MYSIIFTAAIFIAIILNDLIYKNTNDIPLHGSFGLLAVGLVTILWYLKYEIVAWVIIALPIIILTLSYITLVLGTKKSVKTTTSEMPVGIESPFAPIPPGMPSRSSGEINQLGCNLPGPYTAVAPPTTSTVSLPASSTANLPPPTSAPATTATGTPSFSITPLVKGC